MDDPAIQDDLRTGVIYWRDAALGVLCGRRQRSWKRDQWVSVGCHAAERGAAKQSPAGPISAGAQADLIVTRSDHFLHLVERGRSGLPKSLACDGAGAAPVDLARRGLGTRGNRKWFGSGAVATVVHARVALRRRNAAVP
jgi:hypothetical protein